MPDNLLFLWRNIVNMFFFFFLMAILSSWQSVPLCLLMACVLIYTSNLVFHGNLAVSKLFLLVAIWGKSFEGGFLCFSTDDPSIWFCRWSLNSSAKPIPHWQTLPISECLKWVQLSGWTDVEWCFDFFLCIAGNFFLDKFFLRMKRKRMFQ